MAARPTLHRRLRFAAWGLLAPAHLLGLAVWLWAIRGPATLASDGPLYAGWIALSCSSLAMACLLATTPADAIRLGARASARIIMGGAVLGHGLALILLWPSLSDDVVRYRADAAATLAGVSPYATPPAERMHALDPVDRLVAHAELHTIYLPLSQGLFAAIRAAEARLVPPPAVEARTWRDALPRLAPAQRALAWRASMGALAVAATWLLLRACAAGGRSPWWAAVVAWHPLFIHETSGTAHQDIAGAGLLLAAMLMATRRRHVTGALLLGLACGIKPLALVAAPLLLRDAGRRRVPAAAALALAALLPLAPVLLHGESRDGWIATMGRYAAAWEANGSVYRLIRGGDAGDGTALQRRKALARGLGAACLVAVVALAWRRGWDLATGTTAALTAALLTAPVVYPWYLLWPLAVAPLGAWRAALPILVWAGTIVLSYHLWRTSDWSLPAGWALAQYVPVYAAVAAAILWRRRSAADLRRD